MLGEYCYISDASITTFKNELFNDLVVLETKIFKIFRSFAAENRQKEVSGVDRSKICYIAWRDKLLRKANIWKTEIQEDHQAVVRFKRFGSFQDVRRAGRPKVTRQRDDKEDGSALIHHFDQNDSIRFVPHKCRCQYICQNVVSVMNLGSEPINRPENLGLHLPWKLRDMRLQCLASTGPLKSGGWY